MKKKKIIIIGLIVLALIIAGLLLYFLVFKEKNSDNKPKSKPTNNVVETITIQFDADGGEKVEDIKINKGSSTALPTTIKEGYVLEGWYLQDEKIDDEYKFQKDTTLTAKWEKIEEGEKVMKITFDPKGGSKVNPIEVKCVKDSAIISNLPKATKEGYTFRAWEDKHGKAILLNAKLSCEDLTLYAAYDKVEEKPKDEVKYFTVTFDSTGGNKIDSIKVECGKTLTLPKTNPTLKDYNFNSWVDINGKPILDGALLTCSDVTLYATWTKVSKTYKCEAGFELKDGNRCVKLASATTEQYCEGNLKLVNGDCINPSSPNTKGTRTCPSKTYGGWAGTGTYYEAGRGYCGYEELTSYIGQRDNCTSHGGTLAANNHCYKHIEINYVITCASDEKLFAAQVIAPGNGGGCYEVSAPKTKKVCPDGYTQYSVYGECAIVKDAVLQ